MPEPGSGARVSHHAHVPNDNNDLSTIPLAGAVICCTSIPDEKRTILAAQAEQMGAVHRYDLTLDVTHLIVGDHETDKYRYVAAHRPDVRPMTSDWIETIRQQWISDQEIDVDQLELQHTRPTLHGLKFSMTGCEDSAERLRISEQVKANGATYEGDLTKQITHLISFRTEGAKYKAAKAWGIKIVSIEWLRDTTERGMILDEALYDPVLPEIERGRGAWDKTKPRTSLGKRTRDENISSIEGAKRKLRRTASSKLNSQNEQIWGDIVGGGLVTQINNSGRWDSAEKASLPQGAAGPDGSDARIGACKPNPVVQKPQSREGMFSGCHFIYHGFSPEKTRVLNEHVLSHGAETTNGYTEPMLALTSTSLRLFLIVPHDLPVSQLPALSKSASDSQTQRETVTVWWLERCLHHKMLMDPKEHVIGRPFPVFPIMGFSNLSISISAFSGIDLLHVTKAIQLLGANFNEHMTPQSSVVVAKSLGQIRKDKLNYAQQWNIPIVSAAWLWDSISSGTRAPFRPYRARSRRKSETIAECKPPDRKGQIPKDVVMPSTTADIDGNARTDKANPAIKTEQESCSTDPTTKTSNATKRNESLILSPLSERDLNSSSKHVSVAPASAYEPCPETREDYSDAIQNLLTRTKTATAHNPQKEAPRAGRRAPTRIFGRATSNISSGSVRDSRGTSVDTIIANGHPADYAAPGIELAKGHTANERIEMLMSNENNLQGDLDSQPPATQLEYDDPDSREAEQRAMARMMGENPGSRRPGIKEKALTVGDGGSLVDKPRTRRAGREREAVKGF